MKYIKLVIGVKDDYQETLITELLELEFDAFEQLKDKIVTYVPKERFSDVNRERIEGILRAYPGDGFIESEEVVADRNWNKQWEETIRPQTIGPFFIRPTWSHEPAPDDYILLEIDPKMAFGTGYHETTRLMLQFLPDVVAKGDRVLDAGTGTGILAIAAMKLGAAYAIAFDIDEWSIANAQENIFLNEVSDEISIRKGSVEVIKEDESFDLILANIQKNIILEVLPVLVSAAGSGASLLLSGLLESDRGSIDEKADELGLQFVEVRRENEWIALHYQKD